MNIVYKFLVINVPINYAMYQLNSVFQNI